MARRLPLVLIGLLAVLPLIQAQDFQIRTRVDLVVVPVSVRDSKGKLVPGLTADDFVVLEDGKTQRISNFSADPQPLSAAIIVDTGMDGLSLRRLTPLFVAVTGGFTEDDEMASFRFDHFVGKLADFTTDPTVIEKSFEGVKKIAETAPASNPVIGMAGPMPGPFGSRSPNAIPTANPQPVKPSRVLHDAIYEAAKALELRPKERRKLIFVISNGQASGSKHTQKETTELLLRDNIELFAVSTNFGLFEKVAGTLTEYAKVTGGDVYGGGSTGGMERGFAGITEQARNQYVLGYVS